jgi:hypothetical protein
VALSRTGDAWSGLPGGPDGLAQKTFWFSKDFSIDREPRPDISVTGRRLDVPGATFTAGSPGTNAIDSAGQSMLVGVSVPTSGCWEIGGQYHGHTLRYVVWVVP